MKMQSQQIENLIKTARLMLSFGVDEKEIAEILPINSTHDAFLIITAAKILNRS